MRDLVAGLTVGVMCVPQAMSYASIAGLSVEHGLYAAAFGSIFYGLMGTSPHVIIGPTAVMSIIVASSVPRRWHGASVEPLTPTWTLLTFAMAFYRGNYSSSNGRFKAWFHRRTNFGASYCGIYQRSFFFDCGNPDTLSAGHTKMQAERLVP